VMAGITEYFQPGRTVDDLFHDCLLEIVEAPAAVPGATS
jgi:TetR/AcrR family tetracycline transcriptional repressor